MIQENFIKLYENAFKEHWVLPGLTNYTSGTTYSYADIARQIAKIHLALDYLGVNPGDKISLVSRDSAEWCIAFMGIMTYGAVVVPILPDFHIDDIHNIIRHSDSRIVMAGGTHLHSLSAEGMPEVEAVLDLNTLSPEMSLTRSEFGRVLNVENLFTNRYPSGFTKEDVRYKEIHNDTTMLINYTSGTTGFSKGVIITANNLAGNVTYANYLKLMFKGDKILSFLPMAHTYSCAFNFLTPMQCGVHVYVLGVMPTPDTLLKAFSAVRPNLIISVPLILEKIYKNVISPALSKAPAKWLVKVPGLRGIVYKKIKDALVEKLGGNFREMIIGGAAMGEEVSLFLHRIGFPYTIGYGMTECAPLISYEHHQKYVPLSCGKVLKKIMEVRIEEVEDAQLLGVGEIQVRGENVCKGYYKNEEATQQLFTADGWMRTGDLASIDKHGNIFIKGRSKTMLLGPSGQNIYPEEIEAKLSLLPYVLECLVLQRNGKQLQALVYPDFAALRQSGYTTPEEIDAVMEGNRSELNNSLAAYERIMRIRVVDKEFEKTPKKSIKRYLYSL